MVQSTTEDDAPAERCRSTGLVRRRVLLAEDDDEMRDLLGSQFRQFGYDVTLCRNGYDLLDHLASSVLEEEEPYTVVVSDIRMPGLSGLDVLGALGESRMRFPPFILITAFGDARAHALAHRLGASAVFDKPFEMADLLTCVMAQDVL